MYWQVAIACSATLNFGSKASMGVESGWLFCCCELSPIKSFRITKMHANEFATKLTSSLPLKKFRGGGNVNLIMSSNYPPIRTKLFIRSA